MAIMIKNDFIIEAGFFAKKNTHGGVTLLRVFGTSPQLIVPSCIGKISVTEIGAYCFSKTRHLDAEAEKWLEAYQVSAKASEPGGENELKTEQRMWQEICAERLEILELPDSVQKIGDCAFYNCKQLKKIIAGQKIVELGSDVFMNCIGLKQLIIRGSIKEPSGLRLILSRISTTIEVFFKKEGQIEAALLYPEYFETYDEIAPAHLFGRNITGEGFRARQCFKEGVVELASYDGIFPKACVEENEETLSDLAIDRLKYPVGLSAESRSLYEEYVRAHERKIGGRLVEKRLLEELHFLCREGLFSEAEIGNAIADAAGADWAEGVASLMTWKQTYYSVKKEDRYSFD
jgi:hypothetical protein